MPTYTVKKGDTMWALAKRSLQSRTGRTPTNAEISRAVKNARVPGSGDKNKIKPGDKITFSYTAGGGSQARGAEKSNRKQTTRERVRDIERAPKKRATAKKATKKATSSANMNRFRSGERAASTSIKKKTAPAGGSASRWGKSRGAVPRAIRNTRNKQQARLDARKKYYPGA